MFTGGDFLAEVFHLGRPLLEVLIQDACLFHALLRFGFTLIDVAHVLFHPVGLGVELLHLTQSIVQFVVQRCDLGQIFCRTP